MKCPTCKGTGRTQMVTLVQGADFPCIECNGTGEVEMTNEYFLQTATTEELVETILAMCEYKPCFACGIVHCDDESWCHVYSDEAKEFVMKWLKQPHSFE